MFEKYGRFIARHPWKIVVFIGIMNAALGVGLLKINPESGIHQYVPIGSTASKDQKKVSFDGKVKCILFNKLIIVLTENQRNEKMFTSLVCI